MQTDGWTFLTNHAHVLICLHRSADLRVRDIADRVGITERAAMRIITELADGGYISITKDGRRNRYRINGSQRLRHHVENNHTLKDILEALV